MNTFKDMSLPLIFPELRISEKRFKYVKPFVRWVRLLVPGSFGLAVDLPLSDLEYKFAYPEVALEQGRINELEYKKIKKYNFD